MNHLFYMGDFKLYAKYNDSEGLLSLVKRFSDSITMQHGLEKYTKFTFKKGLQVKSKIITLNINIEITQDTVKTYKYFGINETNHFSHTMNK